MKAVNLARIVGLAEPTPDQQQEYEMLTSQEKSIHMKAVEMLNGVGGRMTWEALEGIARLIDSGGYIGSPDEERAIFNQIRLHRIELLKTSRVAMSLPSVDEVSETNVCHKETSLLSECFLEDLLATYKGIVAVDRILWLETVEPVFKTSCAVQLCVSDKRGRIVTLSLYHYVVPGSPDELIETLFPMGTKLGLCNPYLKCSNVGRLALRSDNPNNVIREPVERIAAADPINLTPVSDADRLAIAIGLMKAQKWPAVVELLSETLPVKINENVMLLDSASRATRAQLYSTRAGAFLQLHRFTEAVSDCDVALALNIADMTATTTREAARQAIGDMERQRQGDYNFLTLSFDSYQQDHVADYYGPIRVGSAGTRGRGLFITRDVQVGELLFAEKAFAFRAHDEDHVVMATNYETRRINKGSQYNLVSDILIKINDDAHANFILSYLQTDCHEAKENIPDIRQFLPEYGNSTNLPHTPIMSTKQVDGSIFTNAHEFDVKPAPTLKYRQQLHSSLAIGVDKETFLTGLQYRAKAKQVYETLQKNKKDMGVAQEHSLSGGMALWIVASFMNHESRENKMPNTVREVMGKMLFVYALCPMKAGDEITTSYSDDVNALKSGWGI